MATVPKHTTQHLYLNWKDGKPERRNGIITGTFVMLVGYCPDTLDYFNALFRKARKSFPKLSQEGVICGKVTKSDRIQGFTLLMFPAGNLLKGWELQEIQQQHYTEYAPFIANGREWRVEHGSIDFNF